MLSEETSSQGHLSEGLAVDCQGDGFLVEKSILSLDAPDSATFNFVSSIQDLLAQAGALSNQRQTLLSQEAWAYLHEHVSGANILPCPYFRPISLGSLSAELLPSGAGCGSALLHIEKGGQSLLYARGWSLGDSQALRSISVKPADTLLLYADHDPTTIHHAAEKRETIRFLEFCDRLVEAGTVVTAVVPGFGPLLVLSQALQARGISVRVDSLGEKILQGARRSTADDRSPSWMTAPERFDRLEKGAKRNSSSDSYREKTAGAVLLLLRNSFKGLRRSLLPEKTVWVQVGLSPEQGGSDHRAGQPRWMESITYSALFPISFLPDAVACQELANMVSPSQILLAGQGAALLAPGLARQGYRTRLMSTFPETLF